jgi:predicted nucleic acid-binding protein
MIVISDTSPLSSLALVGCLSLLQDIYARVIIPQAVADELTNSTDEDINIKAMLSLEWIQVQQTTNSELVVCLRDEYNLDLGEAEAIALALELKADELLIDERLGRREAVRLGLSITGVLGVLLIAKNRGLISRVKPIIDALITQASFRVSRQLYEEALRTANELDQ